MATLMMDNRIGIDKSRFERVMDGWRHVIEVSERTLIDNVAATVPWLAPISPAYMAWHNAVTILGWPVWVAWVVAAAIEGLGLSVISTAFQLWREKRTWLFWVAVLATVFYLGVVITVNVLLELSFPAWIAKALLSLLSVPAAVTLALRAQDGQMRADEAAAQAERDAQAEQDSQERKALAVERLNAEARQAEEEREYQRRVDEEERERKYQLKVLKLSQKVAENAVKVPENSTKVSDFPETFGKYKRWPQVPDDERVKIAPMAVQDVMAVYGVDERSAYNWIRYAQKWEVENANSK